MPRFNRLSYQILRWPLLALVYMVIAVEFVVYIALRILVRVMELAVATPAHRCLRRELDHARDYASWRICATALDASKGAELWQADLRSTRYNWPFVKGLISRLREARARGDWRSAAVALRLCSRPNVGGVMAPQLFSQTHTGDPKTVVTDFVEEVAKTIVWMTKGATANGSSSSSTTTTTTTGDEAPPHHKRPEPRRRTTRASAAAQAQAQQPPPPSLEEEDRGKKGEALHLADAEKGLCAKVARDLFAAARESYGRTVLSLSGGGALGAYHFGVVRALHAEDVLPDTVCGTSAGAIVAAFICTRSPRELSRDLNDDASLLAHLCCFEQTPVQCLRHFLKHGVIYDRDRWLEISRWFANDQATGVADMTFEEAYERSGRKLAITVCAKGKRAPPVLLTHLTSPHVLVASAIVATAGVPGLIAPTILMEKDPETGRVAPQPGGESYIDGSIVHDIPSVGLREAFNARFVVASQVNPHLSPLLYGTHGCAGNPSRWSTPRRAEDAWRGGFLLAALEMYLRSDMLAKLNFLKDVDATPGWTGNLLTQNFEGSVTITPTLWFRDLFGLFKNPDEVSLPRFLRHGRIAAYQKISMLRTRFVVERALAHGCAELMTESATSPASRLSVELKVPQLYRISNSSGALHWATPATIGDHYDEDDDTKFFEDDGL